MDRKGYGERWRSWIRGCLASCNMSVIVNGKPRKSFKASRGLRQGDPLSPFLFILVADVLGRMVDRVKEAGLFKGLHTSRDRISATHLQFADDTIFFSMGDESQMVSFFSVVRLFRVLLGLRVNLEKSSVAGICANSSQVQQVVALLGCGIETFPMKYLGLPLGGNPRSEVFWNPIVEMIGKRLEG